jgi:hypothetical protein
MTRRAILETGNGQGLTGRMALLALETEMPPTQRIARAPVIECFSTHFAPTVGDVTAGAANPQSILVRVTVAVRTLDKRHPLEQAVGLAGRRIRVGHPRVATIAPHLTVTPGHRVFTLFVIETCGHPAGDGMAGLAAVDSELPAVLVTMTVDAATVRHTAKAKPGSRVGRLLRLTRDVALGAGNLDVAAGKFVRRGVVIETLCRLPRRHRVAVETALRAEFPTMHVNVAGKAGLVETQVGPPELLFASL